MRLDAVLDVFYVVSSLWGGRPGSQVCSMTPVASTRAVVASRPSPGVTAFVNVNVVPMDTERVLENRTVLVENGRITALGPVAKVAVPAGAARIDGRGKYLIPGLANMHYHGGPPKALKNASFQRYLLEFLASGVTNFRAFNVDVSPEEAENYFRTAEVPSPRLHVASYPRSRYMTTPESLATYAAAAKAAGHRYLSAQLGWPTKGISPQGHVFYDSLSAVARRVGLPVASHDHVLSIEQLVAIGASGGSADHLEPLFMRWFDVNLDAKDAVPEISADSMVQVRNIATTVQRAGLWVTVTMTCYDYGAKYGNRETSVELPRVRQMVKALREAGVRMLMGMDREGVSAAPNELAALVRGGLTPYEALVTGTRNVAQWFGLLDSTGTVAVGKWADLVLLNGNPLADIEHTRKPAGVMINGRWLDRAELDRRLGTP